MEPLTGSAQDDALPRDAGALDRFFEVAVDLLGVVDTTGRVVRVSRSSQAVLGYRPEELEGRLVEALLHPDDVAGALAAGERVRGGEPVLNLVIRTRRRDGEYRWVEWQATVASDGMLCAIGRDVTDRRRTEHELARLQRIHAALSAVNQAIARVRSREALFNEVTRALVAQGGFPMAWIGWLDAATREVRCVSRYGDDMGYLEGLLVTADERPEGQGPAGTAIRTGRAYISNDFLTDPRTGPWRARASRPGWRSTTALPIRLGGEICGALMVYGTEPDVFGSREVALLEETAVDVSFALDHLADEAQRHRLEAQLAQAQKMEAVGQLAGGVAHDFNNMLSVITGQAELALLELEAAHPARESIEEILGASQRSADLTRQLLAFARRQTVQPRVLDLNRTVTGLLKMLRRLIGEGVDLRWLPGADLWPVRLDPSQVDQVLANLVVNARDAMAARGTLTIGTTNVVVDAAAAEPAPHVELLPGEYVALAVSDTGAGMSGEVLARIFEPFFTTKGRGEGTGLGLATVYGIVRQNQGVIAAESTPGRGTTFRIWFRRDASGSDAAASKGADDGLPHGTGVILLVEDAEPILNVTRILLTRLGYSVLVASHPEQALDIAAEHPGAIDLLLTDVIMPGMNGRELAHRVAALRPTTRCLYMSGYTADVMARHGIAEEGIAFVQKPFSTRALAEAVRDAMPPAAAGSAR